MKRISQEDSVPPAASTACSYAGFVTSAKLTIRGTRRNYLNVVSPETCEIFTKSDQTLARFGPYHGSTRCRMPLNVLPLDPPNPAERPRYSRGRRTGLRSRRAQRCNQRCQSQQISTHAVPDERVFKASYLDPPPPPGLGAVNSPSFTRSSPGGALGIADPGSGSGFCARKKSAASAPPVSGPTR